MSLGSTLVITETVKQPFLLVSGHSLWSNQWKIGEGYSNARLHFRVSRVGNIEETHS
jgi:hypothetical protein